MKKINFILILILFFINSCSTESYEEQDVRTIEDWGNEYKWFTKQTNSYNSDYGKSITIDSKGNIFFLGHTGGGVGTKDSFYGNKIYDSDIFIIKYNLYFERQWVKTISANSSEGGNAENAVDIEIDSNDNLIILGHGTGYFDNSTGGGDKAFLLKYNNNGDKIFAKQTDLSISAGYGKISLDNENNIYFLSQGKLIKYNTNYELQWEKNFEGSYPQGGKSIAVDINNNLYLAGNYDNSSSGVSQYFRSEILLRKYNSSNGNQIWERKFPILDDSGTAVTTDRNGNIYISGRTQWTEDNVTSGVNGEEIIGGYSDGFLAKYNSNGDRLWTKIFGSSDGREEVTEIKSDSSNNIYITGYTTGSLEAGYIAINRDIFLIKYNSQGNQIWSRQLGSTKSNVSQSIDLYTANEEVFGLAIDSSNKRIYLVGYTQGDLDGNVLTYSGSSSINSIDAFITRTMNIDY